MARPLRSSAIALLFSGLLTVAAPGTASACSCMVFDLADRLATSDIATVFTGTPTRQEPPPEPITRSDALETWTFDVDAVHRGAVARVTEVRTAVSDASCGIDFIVDRRYLVLARVDADGLATAALCDGSTPVDALSAADLALLGTGTPPADSIAAPAARTTPGVWSNSVSWLAAAVVGVALASVVVVAVRRRPGG